MKLEGGCYCKSLRYVAEGDPIMKAQCHCRECQYITGGSPNVVVGMPVAVDVLELALQNSVEFGGTPAWWQLVGVVGAALPFPQPPPRRGPLAEALPGRRLASSATSGRCSATRTTEAPPIGTGAWPSPMPRR